MSIRNLSRLFQPESLVIIGASGRPGSVGAVLAHNVVTSGFEGRIDFVNPSQDVIEGITVSRSIKDLASIPDLAVICTPPDTVPTIIEDLAEIGTRATVVITAGFGENKDLHGRELQQLMLEVARPSLLRIIGPNCLGIMVPPIGLNASFAHIAPAKGRIAFVTQSGAIVTAIIDWAESRGIGFSHIVSMGDMADVDFGDMLDYLARDPGTSTILLYIEGVTNTRKFMSSARAASRLKPVVVVKAGRHLEAARAAASHTGALAGSDAVYEAAFRRAGLLRVITLEELFDAVETLAMGERPRGDRLAIVTNGGGAGVLAVDAVIDEGGRAAALSEETIAALDEVLPPTWSRANPVDIIGDAPGSRYQRVLEILADDNDVDGILVLHCPVAVASSVEAAEAVLSVARQKDRPALLTNWLGDRAPEAARQLFAAHGIPTYDTPAQAARAFMHMVNHERSQAALLETPSPLPDRPAEAISLVGDVIGKALKEGRSWLTLPESLSVLDAYDIGTVTTHVAKSAEEAASCSMQLAAKTAIKILSEDILHKSDVGGVALNLETQEQVLAASNAMLERIRSSLPDARIEGLAVQPMIEPTDAVELIVGMSVDEQFGPVIMFGHGGTAVELLDDKALGLPPLNMNLAADMISQTNVAKLLSGYRGHPPADTEAIAATLVKLSQLVTDFGEIQEIDINPLLATKDGVLALDTRMRVAEVAEDEGPMRLSISPYPAALEKSVALPDGGQAELRPISPEDELALSRAWEALAPENVRMALFDQLRGSRDALVKRLSQIDYDREMALIAFKRADRENLEIEGLGYLNAEPDLDRAEIALLFHREGALKGVEENLLGELLSYAMDRGIREVIWNARDSDSHLHEIAKNSGFREVEHLGAHAIRFLWKSETP